MEEAVKRERAGRRLIGEESLCVVVPTYNNASTVAGVVERTYEYVRNIIIVNDGSTDTTSEILRELQQRLPVTVVSLPANCGKGRALTEGFKKAKEMGFRYAVTIDSDGQHFPEDIPLLVEAAEKNPDAIIVGSRNLEGKDMSGGSLFANKFSNFWLCVQTGCRLPDTQTGFRLYPLHSLYGLNFITSRYESELELLVYALWHGVKAVPVPINVYYPPREERVSHFRPGKDFTRISILNTVLCIGAVVYGYPRKLLSFLKAFVYSAYSLLFFIIGAFFLTIWSLIYFNIKRVDGERKLHYHRVLWRWAKYISYHIPGVKFTLNNDRGETFDKPAVIICNHQSHLDLMFTMMLTPKMVIMTNNWVWHNPIYGKIIRYADFCPISEGMENSLPRIGELVEQGYSVLVFPEGTRSADCSILPFNKGAFYIAERLNLDILPLYLYGSGLVLPKHGRLLRKGEVYLETGERIAPDNEAFGVGFRRRTRAFESHYKEKLEQIGYDRINRN